MDIFTPLKCGSCVFPNRILMAPLTRARTPNTIPGPLQERYYSQRASAGLVISEATNISPTAVGYVYTSGIYTDEQEKGWSGVARAVHAAGGRLAMQLWHVGRVSHELVQPGQAQPVAPSAIRGNTTKAFVEFADGTSGPTPASTPRELSVEEIHAIVNDYRQAAIRAIRAGCDMVEVHAANGYLLHQFTATGTNVRQDQYGGTLQNRARIVLDVVDAIGIAVGYDKVGVRLSPLTDIFDITDTDSEEMTLYLAQQMSRREVAYLHINEPDWRGGEVKLGDDFRHAVRREFPGVLIYCGHYGAQSAQELLDQNLADAAAFGRPFISNPDLPERFRLGLPLTKPDSSTYYGGGAEGYTDYPFFYQQ
ncbi:alkene reductase [Pseudomonas sp. B8(2017)]|uniref:alkene reductase n=1 Tax=Pseudomonas sp. B8(2017) TaxID=1981711 RepID=UPI000A1D6C46|nr:alkene reductase [Pseudomonas sp. B8(2017)]